MPKLKTTEKCPYCGKPSKVWTEVKFLRAQNAQFKHLLREHSIPFDTKVMTPTDQVVGVKSLKNESRFGTQ